MCTEQAPRTDEEIVRQTNELAHRFYVLRGYHEKEGYRFDQATHPHEVEAWNAACIAQELLRDTDVEDALTNLEE